MYIDPLNCRVSTFALLQAVRTVHVFIPMRISAYKRMLPFQLLNLNQEKTQLVLKIILTSPSGDSFITTSIRLFLLFILS